MTIPRVATARLVIAALSTWALASCSSMPSPVPLIGSRADVARLEGGWSGEFYSTETLRSGTITFTLAAGADTAFGDVLMFPRQIHQSRTTDAAGVQEPAHARSLPIRFVLTSGDWIAGVLDPYEDPECGCTLVTRFDGWLRAGAIEGVYVSTNMETGEVTGGEWKVQQRRAASSAADKAHP